MLNILPEFISNNCTSLLEIKVKCGARIDLGRPKEKPQENKKIFMENLNQIEFIYRGAIENLPKIVDIEHSKNILIFTGKKSFENIKPTIEKELTNCKYTYYNDFSSNPKEEDLERAINNIKRDFDIIVAVGGGSVIDFAKAYKYYIKSNLKLVAIPTTCGTGSEATQFAVLYKNGEKISLDDKSILPEYAIVDSQFVENNPKYLKACTAMDAYCQAIESYWAIKSTPLSREYAKQAMILCKDNIVNYVNTNDIEIAGKIMQASNFAGKAINISRTTAAHALSYKITTKYKIPHGHAVALSMADLFEANSNINNTNCIDKRGVDFVKNRIKEIIDTIGIISFKEYWQSLMLNIGLNFNISELGISNKEEIIKFVNIERLKNNPKDISSDLMGFLGM